MPGSPLILSDHEIAYERDGSMIHTRTCWCRTPEYPDAAWADDEADE